MRLLAACAVALTVAEVGAAPPRHAVVIGNNLGDVRDAPLRYAEDDARRVHDALRAVGDFAPEDTELLLGEDAGAALRAIVRKNDEIRAGPERDDAMLLVYFSGHADADALHLGASRLELALLERLIRGSSAGVRILVLDACRSGAITRVKGASLGAPLVERVRSRSVGQGVVFLTASAASEDAQESERLRGGFFTHYFVAGLLGAADADADADVDLDELYDYAYHATLRASSRADAGLQHPTYRYDFRGHGDVVLAALATTRGDHGRLVLPRDRAYLVLKGDADGPVVAELEALAPARTLTLPAGRYFVRGRGPEDLREGEVSVDAGRVRVVDDAGLQRVAYARMVRRGGGGRRFAHALQLGYLLATPPDLGRPCQGLQLGYSLEGRHLGVHPQVGWCRGGFIRGALQATSDVLTLGFRTTHAWELGRWTLDVGVEAATGWIFQRFTTPGHAPARIGFVGRVGATGGVAFELGRGVLAGAVITVGALMHRREGGPRRADAWATSPNVQAVVYVGKRF